MTKEQMHQWLNDAIQDGWRATPLYSNVDVHFAATLQNAEGYVVKIDVRPNKIRDRAVEVAEPFITLTHPQGYELIPPPVYSAAGVEGAHAKQPK